MGIAEQDWAERLGGTLEQARGRALTGAATLEEAEPHHLSFLASPAYAKAAESSRAGLIILPKDLHLNNQHGAALLRVEHPYEAWAQALRALHADSPFARTEAATATPQGAWVHPTALVDASAQLHPGVWVGAGARIGADCVLYSGAKIYPNSVLGQRCVVHANAVVGSDGFGYTPPRPAQGQAGYGKIPHIGWAELADDVELGANTCVDRGVVGATRIGTGTKIDNLCHLAHNVQVGAHCVFAAQVGVAGSTKIGNYVRIGGQVGINGHITVGDQCEIAAQSGVTMPMSQFLRAWATLKSLSK
jgi:UDP-3-O-[3-hydroxymyristoyl] glucosamine N-acyltransferase